ncbi:MAG TPA: isoaspartyl peptidase/L-asparaginase [Bacteroidia bacterium]|jgi:beta-aspartyl-peptidase (threonine type)|nr:isoaspartyl peptidase/L-asparaginase [Bacteroidia bacterium]
MKKHGIAIHGGAGTILKSAMTPQKEKDYMDGIEEALIAGDKILSNGGTSLDAVEAAVKKMEDNPLFNAGKGSVFTHDGKNEMDACIMEGKTLKAGAVAGVQHVKNPVALARAVMDKSEHVFLVGDGALQFAVNMNLPIEKDNYFFVEHRFKQLQQAKESNTTILDHTVETSSSNEKKFGTVGAVALDVHGNIAAATSTGGMTNKRWGRVGDSPIIGSGTYANNKTCGISCTGHGEFFIRAVVAYDISCLMEYKGLSLKEACEFVVQDKLAKMGGEGGLVAIDYKGNIEMPFNSEGMYRGMKKNDSPFYIDIYKD